MTPGGAPDRRSAGVVQHAVLAVLCYPALLLSSPGQVAADTKTYLYLEPGRLLARAPSMWDPTIGLGTVTHQNIGYLFPMGPWFWTFDRLGFPDWVAQRLWVATIMFAAGAGVLFLLRTLGSVSAPTGPGSPTRSLAGWPAAAGLAAAVVYALSPYVLHYSARISVLLLPWAALPWLIGLTQRAIRTGSWRDPAAFAVVVTLVGGVNATALVLAGIGPLLWLPFAVWVHREVPGRAVLAAAARIGVLTTACSLWWIAGLAAQGRYGIDILRYTETVETVARTPLASEVLRGLGYWFFYGGDLLGPWIEPGRRYTQDLWLIAVGFAVPVVATALGVSTRWRYRAFFVALVVAGTAVAVGAYPFDDPSPAGAAFKELATTSTVGLALRSTPRAVPLVVLGLAVLIGAGLAAVSRRAPRVGLGASVAVVVLAVVGLPSLWAGEMIGENLQRPEEVPGYWQEAAAWLDARGHDTRVLEVPGTDFASYRWGNTVDPITPGLMDRPYVARELIPYGSPPSADLLIALDRRFQEGVLDPAALAPVARLLGVGDIVLRADLQWDRYRTPRPRHLWDLLVPPPDGLAEPVPFGPPAPNEPDREVPLIDGLTLAVPPRTPHPPPVAVFPVEDPQPILRARPAGAVVLAGDGEGVVEAAAAGLLDGDRPVLYAAGLDDATWARVLADGPRLVLTDTNRRQARRWSTVRETAGQTERAGQEPLAPDISDNRLPVFPGADDDARTVVEQRGVRRVDATAYGNTISYTPEDRPALALDGRLDTAWRVGGFGPVIGQRWEVELDDAVEVDRVNVVQPLHGHRNRFITEVAVRLDGADAGTFDLDDRSRTPEGQDLVFGRQPFSLLEIEVTADNVGPLPDYAGWSPAGFAAVRVADVQVEEVVRLPVDLLARTGRAAHDLPLDVVLARWRANPLETERRDPEPALARTFALPVRRAFTLTGQARLADAHDDVIEAVVGHTGPVARASSRLAGHPAAWPGAVLDGDAGTAWIAGFDEQIGQWIEVVSPTLLTVGKIEVDVAADGRHSVPTTVLVVVDGDVVSAVDLPPITDGETEGATTTVTLDGGGVTGRSVRLVVDDVRPVHGSDSFSHDPRALPVSFAAVRVDGLATAGRRASGGRAPGGPAALPAPCRDDLLTLGGRAVHVRVAGTVDDALARRPLPVELCGPHADGLTLGAGDHDLLAEPGVETGLDLDRLVLSSPGAGGGDAPGSGVAPTLVVAGEGRTHADLRLADVDAPFWLVLGQSHNAGWRATAAGLGDLGPPVIVDGYANGWLVDPGDRTQLAVELRWTPQRTVWVALALSALAFVACLAIAVTPHLPARRRPASALGAPLPVLHVPWAPTGVRPTWPVVVLTTLTTGVLAGALVRPWVGLVAAGVALVGLVTGRGRVLAAAGAVAAVGLAGAYVVLRQARNGYPPDFGWPAFFHRAHVLAWMGLVLLGVHTAVDHVRAARSRPQHRPQADPQG